MMSSVRLAASAQPVWNHPRTITVIALQLLYGFLAQIPMIYYIREFHDLTTKEAGYFLIGYSLSTAVMLLLAQVLFFEYFWMKERIRKHRDPVLLGAKASLFVITVYYSLLYFLGLFLIPKISLYEERRLQTINEVMLMTILSIVTIYFIAFGLLEHRKGIMQRVLGDRLSRFRRR